MCVCVWMCVCVKEGDLSTKTETKQLHFRHSLAGEFRLFLIILRYIIRLSSTVSDFILFWFVFLFSENFKSDLYFCPWIC